MISQMGNVRTAYEIATRKEEKQLMLGSGPGAGAPDR